MNFDEAFEALIGHEGGYSNNLDDPGGETMYGITKKVARAHGYAGSMRALPLSLAKTIAKKSYWDLVRCDDLPGDLRFDVFDTCYNSGPERAVELLQLAVGVEADGQIGPKTMATVDVCDPLAVVARFNGHRLNFFTDLDTWRSFGRGWSRRVAKNLIAVKG